VDSTWIGAFPRPCEREREREREREYSRLFGFGPLAYVEPEWREKSFGVVRLRSIRIGGT
jgi:hypothetical protein